MRKKLIISETNALVSFHKEPSVHGKTHLIVGKELLESFRSISIELTNGRITIEMLKPSQYVYQLKAMVEIEINEYH